MLIYLMFVCFFKYTQQFVVLLSHTGMACFLVCLVAFSVNQCEFIQVHFNAMNWYL